MTTVEDSRKLSTSVQSVSDAAATEATVSSGYFTEILLTQIVDELRKMNEYLVEIMENTV